MKGRKKLLAALLAAAMTVLMVAGCGSTGAADTAAPAASAEAVDESAVAEAELSGDTTAQKPEGLSDEVITVALQAEPNSLVPDVVFLGNYISAVVRLMYEPLVIQDYKTMTFSDSGLVTAIDLVDDTHISLTLREGVKFQSGKEFTADDILYQFQQGVRGVHAGDYYSVWDVDNTEVVDDYHITLALKTPWAQAQNILGFNTCLAVDKDIFEAAGGADVTAQYLENAGTGKYKFKEWVPGQYIELERNEDYWDQDNKGYFAGYKFVFINDSSARAMSVQSGDADVALDCAVSDYSVYDADPNVQAVLNDNGMVSTIFLNSTGDRPFKDEKVREAVYWLIDANALLQVANSGLGQVADTTISPVCPMWDGISENATKTVDVEKAKQLLAEAGYADGVSVTCRATSTTAELTMIQEQLRAGGIEMNIEMAEMPVHFQALGTGDYDMYVSSQQCAYYSEAVRTTDGLDYSFADVLGGCGYQDEEYSELCQKALTTYDETERKAAYAEVQKYFREHHVSVTTYTNVGLTVARPDLQGFALYGVGVQDMSNLYSTGN